MTLKRASRKQSKIRVLIAGPAGSGKTYSALKLAHGLTSWDKIAVIDTERGSADLYSHLGEYNTLTLEAPFTPERYIEAINTCIKEGIEVIIIDSITHEWDGKGGILQIHESMTGNSFTNWGKITPRHNAFIDSILQSPVHMICTVRSKQDYVLNEKNGKQVPEKVGMKAITREGFDYEVTIGFDLDIKHNTSCSKDRTGLFIGKPQFLISEDTGNKILEWCASGNLEVETNGMSNACKEYDATLSNCSDIEELAKIGENISKDTGLSKDDKDFLRLAYKERASKLIGKAKDALKEAAK